ncbi:hypothetical protein D4S03_05545 [bacterium]|nr:MAG: hypothetical protein D4S03_05545 [bacterium]
MKKPTEKLRKYALGAGNLSLCMMEIFLFCDALAVGGPNEKEETLLSAILDAFDDHMRRATTSSMSPKTRPNINYGRKISCP